MAFEFKFPDVAEGLVEGKLVSWKVKEGDKVKADDTICEMETDKSVLDIPIPQAGTVTTLHHKAGDTVKVGDVLITLDGDGAGKKEEPAKPVEKAEVKQEVPPTQQVQQEIPPTQPPPPPAQPAQAPKGEIKILPKEKKLAKEMGVDYSHIAGTGPQGRITSDDIKAAAGKAPAPARQTPTQIPAPQKEIKEGFHPHIDQEHPCHASPAMRKHAREQGIPVEQLTASAAPSHPSASPQTVPPPPPPAVHKEAISIKDREGDSRVKIEGIRQAIYRKMSTSWQHIPHSSIMIEVPIDKLVEERNKVKEEMKQKGIKLTYLAYIAKVTAVALEKFPKVNSTIDESTNEQVLRSQINVGIAVDTENGLIVPNIKETNRKSITDIAQEIQELADKARARKLSPKEITGGTFTITNLGSFNALTGLTLINHPEVAILGVGRMFSKVELQDGKPVEKKILPLTITIDHRILDGADSGRFLKYLADHLSNPSLMILDVI